MRLDKFVSLCSGLSRTDTKKEIAKGAVKINGQVNTQAKTQVKENKDEILLLNQVLTYRKNIYILMNKPQDVICAAEDKRHRTVLDLLTLEMSHRKPHSVGRLDIDTTGMVLLTDDGQWSFQISSPKKKCAKIYEVITAEPIPESTIQTFAEGLYLDDDDKITLPAELEILEERKALLTLHEGRFHQVKRMFAAVGNHVNALHRRQIGGLALSEDLQAGEWRLLTEEEKEKVFQ